MIHGETRIVLRNPISGNILKDVKSENTFQSSVLGDVLRCLGRANNNPFANQTFHDNPMWQNLVGGIFLFRDSITAPSKYMPAGNLMVGNGSYGFSNATEPNELGSFNSQESSASASAITQVYDFTTNQSNGQIGCVCLTSQTGGYIGYGNNSGQVPPSTKYDFKRNQNITEMFYNSEISQFIAIGSNTTLVFYNSAETFTVRKLRTAITQASVFDGFYTETVFNKATVGNHKNWTTNNFMCCLDNKNNCVWIIPGTEQSGLAPSAVFYIYKYDIANDTLTEESFMNTSSNSISVSHSSYGGGCKSKVAHGLLFAVNSNERVDVFDLSNNNHIVTLDCYARWGSFWDNIVDEGPNGLIFLHSLNPGAVSGTNCEWIYDTVTGSCRPTNGSQQMGNEDAVPGAYSPIIDAMNRVASNRLYLYKCPLYLATINNLQAPVTKTAAQTMKVTYTLTEA